MNFLKKIPMWGWLGIGGAVAIGLFLYQRKKQRDAAAAAAAAQAQADASQSDPLQQDQTPGQPLYPLGPVGGSPGLFFPPSNTAAASPGKIDITLPDPNTSHPLGGGGPPHRHHHHHHHPHDHHHKRHRQTLNQGSRRNMTQHQGG